MSWVTRDLDKGRVREVSQRFDVDTLLATILVRRGLDAPQDALYLLENKKVFLHNAFLLPDMAMAVERIIHAMGDIIFQEGQWQALHPEKIMIVGDRDADGITSTALMANYFLDYHVQPLLRLPQGDEPYGLSVDVVKEAKIAGVTLIICVDNGSSAYEAMDLARAEQIDVIIFDHHDVGREELPVAAFVNPKRNQDYRNQQLSASVVVLKALFGLDFYQAGYFNRCDVLLYGALVGERTYQVMALQVINLEMKNVLQVTVDLTQPHLLYSERQRMIRFVDGHNLFVYGASEQIPLLGDILGVDVSACDLANELESFYAGISQYRLNELIKKSRFFCYQEQPQLRDGLLLLYRLWVTANHHNFPHYNRGFALASIGLLADLAPLLDENRIILYHGLKDINEGKDERLARLLSFIQVNATTVSSNDLNWKFIPLINASGRMGQPDVALRALLINDIGEQKLLAQRLVKLNDERRDLTTQWWERSQKSIKESLEQYQGELAYFCEGDLPRGLTGLLAGRISRVYDCFALIIAIKGNGTASASMRSPYAYHVAPFIEHCKDLFIDAGGHAQAGGFTLKIEALGELESRLMSFVKKIKERHHAESHVSKERYYDAKIPSSYFNETIIHLVERLAPYGSKFEPLIFYIPNAKLESATLIGKQEEHLKLGLTIDQQHWQALFWDEAERFGELAAGMAIDVLCKLRKESGRFQGYQLELLDFKEA